MIIACDTSSMLCSVAVVQDQNIIFQREVSGAQVHIEKLTPFLQEALAFSREYGRAPDALALAIGPGSFNGLRIGLATMKALALSLELPLIPVPTTDGLAFGVQRSLAGPGRAVIFSHRDLVHYADYELGPSREIKTPEFHYGSWDELEAPQVEHYFGSPERALGEWLASASGTGVKSRFSSVQAHAGQIACLAEQRPDDQALDLDALEPFYNAQYLARKWIPPSF